MYFLSFQLWNKQYHTLYVFYICSPVSVQVSEIYLFCQVQVLGLFFFLVFVLFLRLAYFLY